MLERLTDHEKRTILSYEQNAVAWDNTHSDDHRYWTLEREIFNTYLPKGKVLEIGAGGGHDAHHLLNLGYDYVGIEPSQQFIALARKKNPEAVFINGTVYDIDFPENSFDGFWTAEVLLHIPKARIDLALQNIQRVTKPGGIGFISVKQGEGERVIEEDRGEHGKYSRLFSFYSQTEFTDVLTRNSFSPLYTNILPPDGDTIWMTYIVKKTTR